MSHFTTIQTQIRDLDALSHACAEMDLKLLPNTTCRGYAGTTSLAPHVIKLAGPYDIAVEPAPENDGSYGLTTDWWDGHVAREVGDGYVWRSKLISFDFTKLISGDFGGISTLISSFGAIGLLRKERDDDGTGSFGTARRVLVGF